MPSKEIDGLVLGAAMRGIWDDGPLGLLALNGFDPPCPVGTWVCHAGFHYDILVYVPGNAPILLNSEGYRERAPSVPFRDIFASLGELEDLARNTLYQMTSHWLAHRQNGLSNEERCHLNEPPFCGMYAKKLGIKALPTEQVVAAINRLRNAPSLTRL
jgi:hypothetical protein